jgi:S-DNA-T family DNA segregation ATPase FtsK/SpoIIIE
LAAKGIRIMAPIPGKSAVGVEIPNRNPSIVQIRSVINSTKFREEKATLPIAVGKTISGEVYADDLAKMPHLLMAGATGSGKSIGINTIIVSLLYRLYPSDVKFVIIDPKKIELSIFAKLKNHFLAVCPDIHELIVTTPENAVLALKSVEYEMEQRYDRLAAVGVRNVADYNEKVREGKLKDSPTLKHRKIPYLIIVIDELADLMLTASREVEEPIARLAQLARAVGIHLVVATQRPSVDVITGVIKANFSARIAYQVASKIDSRTILDMNGAEQLLGNGDMLYLPAGSPKPVRIQNAFVSSQEVERVTDYIAGQRGYSQPFQLPSVREKERGAAALPGERDELFLEAARLVVRHQQGSVSLLQRRLAIGYSRAGKLIDQLESAGIVGQYDGSKAREVLVESEDELENLLRQER